MLAVLENGVECFQKYALARDRKRRLLFQEAEYWVQDTNRDWPFSFANVCETLGFAADCLRQGLREWKAATLESRAKANIYQLASRNGKRKRSIAVSGRQTFVCIELPVDVCPVDCIHLTKNEAEAFRQVHELYIDRIRQMERKRAANFGCRSAT